VIRNVDYHLLAVEGQQNMSTHVVWSQFVKRPATQGLFSRADGELALVDDKDCVDNVTGCGDP
jgi:hypothetical protein